jgi:peptide/nickel transport system substrate-binding protein
VEPAGQPTGPQGTKTLKIGMLQEPRNGILLFSGGGLPALQYAFTFQSGLTVYDDQGAIVPRMAQKVPSIVDGDWIVRPDGSMQETWKLRPDLQWHDGAPVTADDFAFGVQLLNDRDLPLARSSGQRLIASATAPDPQTLIVEWRSVYVQANASGPLDIVAVPRHLLGDLYLQGDKGAFTNNDYWNAGFVGTGPFKLGEWTRGASVEALAFDGYFMGRPRIDRIVYSRIGDDNLLYLNLVSGNIDMTTMGGFDIAHYVQAKNDWEAQGSGTALGLFAGTRDYRFQFRDPTTPWAKDVRVRQALTHMADRPALAQALQFGLAAPADTIVSPSDPIYKLLEQRGLPKYPYDLNAAQRLLGEAGWTRGGDGAYRAANGEPFTIDLQTNSSPENIVEANAVAGQWRAAGLQTTTTSYADGAANQSELQRTFIGVQGNPQRDTLDALQSYISTQTGSEANRWQGANWNSYVNPTIDRLYDQALVTFDTGERNGLVADILKIVDTDIPAIHLFYYMARQTVSFRKGITGPGPVPSIQMSNAWNIETWDIR